MPRLKLPNSVSLQNVGWFLKNNRPFEDDEWDTAVLEFHSKWVHLEPIALAATAAWGAWCHRRGKRIFVENLSRRADYAARMKLFQHLGLTYEADFVEHEEAGRFLPISQVVRHGQVGGVIGSISALLHLEDDPESLAAVQYCVSELIRNVLEHSGSPDGAFVCAHRYTGSSTPRVTIAVADCGRGIASHLGRAHPEAASDDMIALGLAMKPGVTGALPGPYGTPENAGAGLFITRCIAKGTGGYFLLVSGNAAYRLRRARNDDDQMTLFPDAFDEARHDRWHLPAAWLGTAVAVEIRTDQIADYQGFFQWIFRNIPSRSSKTREIRFT
jgi:anti-sigma regulatory factor (Ser/Thr protein kinase)